MLGLAKSTFFLLFSESLVWVGFGQQCGSRPGLASSFSNDIVGGCYARQGEYPWEGLIQFFDNGVLNETCGLTLISSRYALTSARCINISQENYFNKVNILLGVNNISDTSGVITTINQSTIYPGYNGYNISTLSHNIAIIKLNVNINFTNYKNIQPICLPAVDNSLIHKPSDVAGWGFYSFDNFTCTNASYVNATTINYQNSTARSLVKATVPVISNELCQLYYPEEANATLTNATICAGTDWRGAMGHGDRGTPLMIANLNGTWFQTGIFSAHYYNTNMHEAFAQRLYTRVSWYCDWINSTTNGEAQCTNVEPPTATPAPTDKSLAPSTYASFVPLLILCVLLVSNLF